MTVTFDIKCLPEFQILSIRNFRQVSSEERVEINKLLEENYLMSPLSVGDNRSGYNFPIVKDDTLFFTNLYKNYTELCYKLFGNFHISPQSITTCWCYRSNINDRHSFYHNHRSSSTINGVYYYQVDGDGISFKIRPTWDHQEREFHYLPQPGELLIFPDGLHHKPDLTTSQNWRYSINMEILTEESSETLFKKYGLS